jgi:hypothetical protein
LKSLKKEKVVKLTKELSLANKSNAQLKGANETLHENFLCLHAKHMDLEVEHDLFKESTSSNSNDATKSSVSITSNGCARCNNINVESCATNLEEMHVMSSEITRLTTFIKEDKSTQRIGEFEKHTKAFGSGYMKKYGFVKGKGLGKNGQGHQEPIPFSKNNKTSGVGANGAILGGMVPTRTKVDGKQPKSSSPQVKVNKTNTSQASKPKPHAHQSSFYADYVLNWDRKGKVVAKYVGPRTKNTLVKRNVWVPKVLVTNTLGPKSLSVPKTRT